MHAVLAEDMLSGAFLKSFFQWVLRCLRVFQTLGERLERVFQSFFGVVDSECFTRSKGVLDFPTTGGGLSRKA